MYLIWTIERNVLTLRFSFLLGGTLGFLVCVWLGVVCSVYMGCWGVVDGVKFRSLGVSVCVGLVVDKVLFCGFVGLWIVLWIVWVWGMVGWVL